MFELNILILILIWILIGGVVVWGRRAAVQALGLPAIVSIIGTVVVCLMVLIAILRLVLGMECAVD